MPTLVAAFTLVALVRLSALDFKPAELALLFALIVGAALWPGLPGRTWLLNVVLMYAACTAWLWALQATDHLGARPLHALVLVGGFVALLGSRLYLDLIVYGLGL